MSFDPKLDLPDLYFETTSRFKYSPARVKKQENFCKHWTTTDLHVIPSSKAGTYLALDLHRRPHYQYYPVDRDRKHQEALEKGIHYHFLDEKEAIVENSLYHFTHDSPTFMEKVTPIINSHLDLDKLTNLLIQRKADEDSGKKNIPANRGNGNVTTSVGFSSQNIKFDGTVTAP